MEQERHETYERIPWEMLERRGGDRQWWLVAVAGAVALGSLAYSFVKSQPVQAPTPQPVSVSTPVETVPVQTVPPAAVVPSPMVMAEADLYAVEPERLLDRAAAHAEWFAVEYFTVDGSEESRGTLGMLLPEGVPLPESPPGTQVFVDWVGAQSVTETGPLTYEVEVVVRSLVAEGDEGFSRQPPRTAFVEVAIGEDGLPRVVRPPLVSVLTGSEPLALTLLPVPDQIAAQVEASHGRVVGGEQLGDGRWRVVVMSRGVDGVTRPITVVVP